MTNVKVRCTSAGLNRLVHGSMYDRNVVLRVPGTMLVVPVQTSSALNRLNVMLVA